MTQDEVLEVVRSLRKQRNLSFNEVAKGVGYKTGKGWRDVEIGKSELTVNHVFSLAKFYDVPIGIFFGLECNKMEHKAV